jgi:hypothetical protein
VTVIQDPISAKLKRAMNASLNFDAVFVMSSDIATIMKQKMPKIANGKGQKTISTHLFPLASLYPGRQLVQVILSFLHDIQGLEQAVQLFVVVLI